MPVLTNSIGGYTFFDLLGVIYASQQQVELIDRPGVDGSGARLTGKRGKPFSLVSVTYYANFTAAKTAMATFVAMKTSLQNLTRNSVSYGNYIVLEIAEAKPPFAVINVAGAGGAQCRAEVKWTLVEP